MTKISYEMVHAYSHHEFVADASDLGLAVGQFPQRLPTDMGNGLDFLLWSATDDYVIYRQGNGCITLRVFND